MTPGGAGRRYQVPVAVEHDDECRRALMRWRLKNAGLDVVDDMARFPCQCATPRPWRTVEGDHPAWCRLEDDEHPWTACTFTPMVSTEGDQ